MSHPAQNLATRLRELDVTNTEYATQFVDVLLAEAQVTAASDVHVQPVAAGLQIRWRIDGVLHELGVFPRGETADVVARLKVLADLLTYRTEVPQEGRIRERSGKTEIRVSTFPTLYGERAVVRLLGVDDRFLVLHDLGLDDGDLQKLRELLGATGGVIIFTGPAGSGKTTSAYACLRELVRQTGHPMSIVSLEDPIEVAVDGVAQAQVNPGAGFTLVSGLRSLLRQDPQAIMVGEIRDRETAEIVFQAALTGHLVITTFHAGSAAEAITRLADMQIEPYQLRSGVLAIVSQRLVRRLCACAREVSDDDAKLGLSVTKAKECAGCAHCQGTGYSGRGILAELLLADSARAALGVSDAATAERHAKAAGMTTLWQRAKQAVENGWTSPQEVRRVLGKNTRISS